MRLFLFVLAVAIFTGILTSSMVNVDLPLIRAVSAASNDEWAKATREKTAAAS